ncbi:kinase [Sporosarcina highlanderae]|uniref:Kinase n=1 Tax=Sporosarcina highlanderae TaxID=3035916 RepID=A0ABT8JQ12_9BACL|nr:kinase [Sporosarcina highlanderae]MDN4607240.1 kinase [Sporosarcina highlanderae]
MFVIETAETLYNQFLYRSNKNRPLIVGIDGLGGAGKTTFVKEVEQELKDCNCEVRIYHLDEHIVETSKRYHTGFEEWYEYYYLQWDISGLLNSFLVPLRNSENLQLPFYDKSTDSISYRQVELFTNSIVLIEGIFLQRKEWKSIFDYVIFLNCPFELRKERVLGRDSYIGDYHDRMKKYTERYWPAEKHYLDTIRPDRIADLVISIE